MSKRTVLTGITTTGTPHLGNYVGAIKPCIQASHDEDVQSYYFLADYHALVKNQDPDRMRQSTLEIAATWLALGLDTDRAVFYRQSDIPEILELTWIITCSTAKGLMNRAHAYKAVVQDNVAAGDDPDYAITMGLFSYPVLMAADILIYHATHVPVGEDQKQHLELTRDLVDIWAPGRWIENGYGPTDTTTFTMVMVPYNALLPNMVTDYSQRTSFNMYRMISILRSPPI